MEEKKKNNKIKLILGGIVLIIILVIIFLLSNFSKEVNSEDVRQIQLGDIIILNKADKQLLRGETEEYIKENLKTPSIAEFQEQFEYICDEENIIKVKGYVDSQNSFGAMLRSEFVCEYFAVDNLIDTLVYLKFSDTEVLNIKDTYIKEYKKQRQLEDVKSNGNELNQEKLDYIMNDFNGDELNDVGKILTTHYDKKETTIDIQTITKSSKINEQDKEYWTNFNICSILHYFKEFDIVGTVTMNIYDIDNKEIIELSFDDNFIKNKWNDNSKINLVREIFGENYKIIE